MEIVGRGGAVLGEQWGDEPTAYLGITVPNFPNLFCLYGPGTNLRPRRQPHLPLGVPDAVRDGALRELLVGGPPVLECRREVHDEYNERYQHEIAQMVWAHKAVKHSHYKNPEGKVFTLSPWPIPQYWRWTKDFQADDYLWD